MHGEDIIDSWLALFDHRLSDLISVPICVSAEMAINAKLAFTYQLEHSIE